MLAIVTDSLANLPSDVTEKYGIKVLPINLNVNGKLYLDGVDISTDEAYQMLKENSVQFLSSPSSVGEYIKAFKDLSKIYEGIVCITLSSKLSGAYNVATLAASQVLDASKSVPIEIIDSLNATVGEGLVVTAAAAAAASGRSISEVTGVAKNVISSIELIGILDTIQYVYRTGRIPKLAAKYGSLLKIHPVIGISNGSVHVSGITMNQKSGLGLILKKMRKNVGQRPVHVAISHAEALEAGQTLKEKIRAVFDCKEIWLTDFSPVMAYATGTGVIVVSYYTE